MRKKLFTILGSAVIGLAVFLLPLAADQAPMQTSFASTNETSQSDSDGASLSSIDTSSYSHDAQFDGYDVKVGIDVSKYQGTIDWNKVKADGIDFAFIRVAYRGSTSGSLNKDANYKTNLDGAIAAGLDVGVYIYSQAITTAEAEAEADYILQLISGYDITLPVVLDYEYYSDSYGYGRLSPTTANKTDICTAFCKRIEEKNYTAMVYANKSMLTNALNAAVIAKDYPIWLAQYAVKDSATNTIHASYDGTYSYWQYTSGGTVDGISGRVDMNFMYVKKPSATTGLSQTASGLQSVTLKWAKVPYVYGYRVYRQNASTGAYDRIGSTVGANQTTYTDESLDINSSYSYKVRALYKLNTGNYYGGYSDVITASTAKKTVTNAAISKRTSTALTLSWDAQTEVSGYRISRLNTATGKYKTIAYVEGASSNTYKDSGLASGTSYTYKVRAYYIVNGKKAYFDYSNKATGTTKPGKVTGVSAKATKNSVTISWNAQENVSGYKVYVKSGGSWKKIKTIKSKSTSSYKHTGLKTNKTYTYSVIAYYKKSGSNTDTKRSASVSAKTKTSAPDKVTGGKIKTYSSRQVVSWTKQSGVSGYYIYRRNTKTKKYTKIATLKGAGQNVYIIDSSPSSKYTYHVAAYDASGKKTLTGKKSSAASTITDTQTLKTSGSNINIRKKASTSSKVVTTLAKGKTMTIKGVTVNKSGRWYKISCKKGSKTYTGYISADYVRLK